MSLLAMFPASLRAFAMLGAFRGYGCALLQPGTPGLKMWLQRLTGVRPGLLDVSLAVDSVVHGLAELRVGGEERPGAMFIGR